MTRNRQTMFVTALFVAGALAGAGATGVMLLAGPTHGVAAPVDVDGHTGSVWQLSVNTLNPIFDDGAPVIDDHDGTVDATDDQTLSISRAWVTACPHVTVDACRAADAPEIGIHTRSVGGSAQLAYAVAMIDAGRDITGDLTVAATGELGVNGTVFEVGGIIDKTEAAELADVDLLLVPNANLVDARSAADPDVTVIGVATVDDAVTAICAHSNAGGCTKTA